MLGEKIYQSGLGDQEVRARIVANDQEIQKATDAKVSAKKLQAERFSLFTELAGHYQGNNPELENETKAVSQLKASVLKHNDEVAAHKAGQVPVDWRRATIGYGIIAICVFQCFSTSSKTESTDNSSNARSRGKIAEGQVPLIDEDAVKRGAVSGSQGSPLRLSAFELYEQYKKDRNAADQKYKGKWIAVTGKVVTRDDDPKNYPGAILIGLRGSQGQFENIGCYFNRNQARILTRLDDPSNPPIIGLCSGVGVNEESGRKAVMEVQLVSCDIPPTSQSTLTQEEKGIPRKTYQRGESTVTDFIENMDEIVRNKELDSWGPGGIWDHSSWAFSRNGFIKTFGEPDSDHAQSQGKRAWSYKCSDGSLQLSVQAVSGLVIVDDVDAFRQNNIVSRLTTVEFIQQVEELVGIKLTVPGNKMARRDVFVQRFGYPSSDISHNRIKAGSRHWSFSCKNGVVSFDIILVSGRRFVIDDFSRN